MTQIVVATHDPGDTIRVETTVKDNPPFSDTETDLDPDTIEITIKDPDGTDVVTSQSMTKHATGEYYYLWDSSGQSEGDYEVVVDTEYSESGNTYKEVLDDSFIRLA